MNEEFISRAIDQLSIAIYLEPRFYKVRIAQKNISILSRYADGTLIFKIFIYILQEAITKYTVRENFLKIFARLNFNTIT